MKHLLISLLAVSGLFAMSASAAEDHTAEVCSVKNTQVCVHLGIHEELTSEKEGKFMIHALTPADAPVSNVKADLWMDMGHGHGHGSAPLTLKDLGGNHVLATNAWFVMMGQWQVRIEFTFEGETHQVIIPVNILK